MPSDPPTYELTQDVNASTLIARLQERFPVQLAPRTTSETTYYDTFDWRLYSANSTLDASAVQSGLCLQWRSIVAGQSPVALDVATMPRFVWDLPDGPLQAALEPLVAMRALLPIVSVRVVERVLRILNEDEKTVLRLQLQEIWVLDDRSDVVSPVPGRVLLAPVKGYDRSVEEMQTFLCDEIGLSSSDGDFLKSVLAALGRQPGDYSSKLDAPLRPEMPAGEALKAILLDLLVTMERNEPGLIADLDSEFLHDFRVAVRRTRSALSQVRGVLPSEAEAHFRGEFGWLGEMTGATRDLDVYLLQFEEYRADLPPFARNDLSPLRTYLTAHQRIEHTRLVDVLQSERYETLKQAWRRALVEADGGATTPLAALQPICTVASKRLRRVFKQALQEGRAIGPDSPASDLHDLRKTCKKLRYLLEFFQSLYDSGAVKRVVKELKSLQDNLGMFQDYEVQLHALRSFGQEMVVEGLVSADALMAMGILIGHLYDGQHDARAEFTTCFSNFDSKPNRAQFRELLASAEQS